MMRNMLQRLSIAILTVLPIGKYPAARYLRSQARLKVGQGSYKLFQASCAAIQFQWTEPLPADVLDVLPVLDSPAGIRQQPIDVLTGRRWRGFVYRTIVLKSR